MFRPGRFAIGTKLVSGLNCMARLDVEIGHDIRHVLVVVLVNGLVLFVLLVLVDLAEFLAFRGQVRLFSTFGTHSA